MADVPPFDADLASLSFEEILERLEQVVSRLEQGDAPLEQALAIFEQGVALSREGGQRLDEAERRIEELLDDGTTAPLSSPDNGEHTLHAARRSSRKEPRPDE